MDHLINIEMENLEDLKEKVERHMLGSDESQQFNAIKI